MYTISIISSVIDLVHSIPFLYDSDAGEREPIVASDPIYIETSNHTDDPDYQNDNDLFCPASPTTVPTSAIKSRSNSGMYFKCIKHHISQTILRATVTYLS